MREFVGVSVLRRKVLVNRSDTVSGVDKESTTMKRWLIKDSFFSRQESNVNYTNRHLYGTRTVIHFIMFHTRVTRFTVWSTSINTTIAPLIGVKQKSRRGIIFYPGHLNS